MASTNNIFMGNGGSLPRITSIIDNLLRKRKDYITYEEILATSKPENEKIKETNRTAIKKAICNINRELKKKGLTFDYQNGKNARHGFRYPSNCQDPLKELRENSINSTKQYLLDFIKSSIHMLPKTWIDKLLPQILTDRNAPHSPIIECDSNMYLKNIDHLSSLHENIKNKEVITFNYNVGYREIKKIIFHPQFLKEYNNRWFLFGLSENKDKSEIINCPLDRIKVNSIEVLSDRNYKPAEVSFYTNYFKNIVGVTKIEGLEPERIIIQTFDKKVHGLILSKPIHSSQKENRKFKGKNSPGEIELNLCYNRELIGTLLHYGGSIKVLEPISLREKILDEIDKLNKLYSY